MTYLPAQKPPAQGTQQRFPRWTILFGICILLFMGAWGARHFYWLWKERHLVRQARVYLQLNDFESFDRILHEAKRLNPNDVDICRLYAQMLAQRGDTGAFRWLHRAVQLTNGGLIDQIALAEAAVGFKRIPEAAKALQSIASRAHDRADYQDLAGQVAQSSGKFDEAEAHFMEAVRIAPDKPSYQFHLVVARLDSKDSWVRAKAQSDLEQFQSQPELAKTSLRTLLSDALRNGRMGRALLLADKLSALPHITFNDRLACLEALQRAGDAGFASRLSDIQEEAVRAPANLRSLLFWMNRHDLSLFAKDWTRHLPPGASNYAPVRLEIAQAYANSLSWKDLGALLDNENWGSLDYVRNAFLARANRAFGEDNPAAQAAWGQAIQEAGNDTECLTVLAQMATNWGWDAEAAKLNNRK